MEPSLLTCDNITKRFGNNLAINKLNIDLRKNEILSILGPSGCGKTTLLRIIAGLEDPDYGNISINNRIIHSKSIRVPTSKRNVGLVFQDYALFPHLTVKENILFGTPRNINNQTKSLILQDLLELTKLFDLEYRYPHELSGGQQQRVALARTLATKPDILLMDEPLSNLDESLRYTLRKELRKIIKENGTATIFVTHDKEEAFSISDRVAVMSDGVLHQIDTPDKLYFWPETKETAILSGTCEFITGIINDGKVRTSLGNLVIRKPYEYSNGSNVEVGIRPSDFNIHVTPNGKCTVLDKEFTGDDTIFYIQSPVGEIVRCKHKIYTSLFAGLKVNLFPSEHTQFNVFMKT